MKHIILGIKFALSYFTALPIRFGANDDLSHPKVLLSMLLALPFVGLLLSTIMIGVFVALEPLGWLAAIIAGVMYMALYGFIHTEAIIDVADAVYAKHSGKDPYVIIKEPSVGAMGVLYGVSFLILKISALSYLLMHHLFLPFMAIAAISRISLLVLIRAYAFRSLFVSQLKENLPLLPLAIVISLYTALGGWFFSWHFMALLGIGIASALALSALAKRSLGFINGDVLGMSLEGVELILMLAVLLAWV
ncbi:MAG: adenosylcobinamide-GDP ribazoletransferase [Campylobacterota bacterium]|nr:adenosylcobinamide-GDP ribazoletransferase [Campylobacterota bacterium]